MFEMIWNVLKFERLTFVTCCMYAQQTKVRSWSIWTITDNRTINAYLFVYKVCVCVCVSCTCKVVKFRKILFRCFVHEYALEYITSECASSTPLSTINRASNQPATLPHKPTCKTATSSTTTTAAATAAAFQCYILSPSNSWTVLSNCNQYSSVFHAESK